MVRLFQIRGEEQRHIQTGYTEKLIERPGTGKVVFQSYVLRNTETEGLVRIEGIYWRSLSENINLISSRR
jgi:membrane protein implicated in regulation of membrane protease activity